MNTSGGLGAFAARSAVAKVESARWGLGSYGRFRTWCEAYPSTSMTPTSCGWVLGGSCSCFLALEGARRWKARPRWGECKAQGLGFAPHPDYKKAAQVLEDCELSSVLKSSPLVTRESLSTGAVPGKLKSKPANP